MGQSIAPVDRSSHVPGAARRRRRALASTVVLGALVAAVPGPGLAASPRPPVDAWVALDRGDGGSGGRIAPQFVGLSVEWSLIERYMGPSARPAFANLLRNLRTGVLRIGGSSQDLMQFQPQAANTIRNITADDLTAIRATLDRINGDGPGKDGRPASWGVILGTALAPRDDERPWVGPEHARAFTTQGVAPVFRGRAQRYVTSIGLGNEPDVSFDYDLIRYLADFQAYQAAGVTRPFALDVPSTSERIAPWQSIADRSVPTRFFWDWPAILDAIGPSTKAVRASQGAATTDHFYPTARGCTTDPYRCASIERLLSDERLANFNFQVHTHAREAARRGLTYRLGELNTAAGRGVDGVSNVAASAVWALDAMFNAACPQPPDAPGANADCSTGAIGVNFHNSEVRAFFFPQEGNAYYNAITYDPTPAAGAPSAAPEYYALLFFSRLAQDTRGLRPATVRVDRPQAGAVKAWRVGGGEDPSRLFVINKGAQPANVEVAADGSSYDLYRMTPHDPDGTGRTLDAPQVRIDGRAVAADGTWPGFAPQSGRLDDGRLRVTVGGGEAVVVEPTG
jgi:hypothetical protein